ncbi:putative UV-damage endonuclease [Hypsibius exemplaris]|uniref:UV-damage endonuclease n=1 Tax=Hypsibius exemplaris TaxID=2072580 RepID=A0A1W0X2R8_HYPEX|nr:putative UV-damage endonuclease [Hypsibius exemplaris]
MNPLLNLGYCCINTELQAQKIFCSRTMRLATFRIKGLAYAQELALQNLRDLLTILQWNQEHGITAFRVSSDLFPLADHPECGYSLDFAQDLLAEVGAYARQHQHRLTMHPGQFHVLTAKTDKIIKATVAGLEYHCDILDRMGMDKQSIMVIHGGGVYGDKPAALARLEENLLRLKENVRNRLVLENCEMAYNIEDLLPISRKLKIPIVIDYHHDSIHPSSKPPEFYHEEVFQVWDSRGIKPKVHVSQSVPDVNMNSINSRRKHSDYIDVLPDALLKLNRFVDVMFEAKKKELSVLRYREMTAAPATIVKKASKKKLSETTAPEEAVPEAKQVAKKRKTRAV